MTTSQKAVGRVVYRCFLLSFLVQISVLFKVGQNIGKIGKCPKSLINVSLIAKSNKKTPKKKPSSYQNVVSKSLESLMTLPGSLGGQNYFHNNPMTLSLRPR